MSDSLPLRLNTPLNFVAWCVIDDARVAYELHGAREQNATTAAGRGFLRNDDASVAPELHGASEQKATTQPTFILSATLLESKRVSARCYSSW